MTSVVDLSFPERVLPTGFDEKLSRRAEQDLREMGVEVRLDTRVAEVDSQGVELQARAGAERVATRNVIWAAGIRPSPIAESLGCPLDRSGRGRRVRRGRAVGVAVGTRKVVSSVEDSDGPGSGDGSQAGTGAAVGVGRGVAVVVGGEAAAVGVGPAVLDAPLFQPVPPVFVRLFGDPLTPKGLCQKPS